MKIEFYKVKGKTKYRFRAFLGKDYITGKQQRVFKSGFDTKREAEKAYLELTTTHKPTEKSKATFKQVYEVWMETYQLGVKKSTLKHTKQVFRDHILPAFGDKKIQDITSLLVQSFVNQQFESAVRADTRFSCLKRILTFAKKQEYIYQNPADFVEVLKRKKVSSKKKKSENYYTKPELEKFLSLAEEKLPYKWFVFFRLLAYTGIRRGEALALTWDDIDIKTKTVSISKTISNGDNGHFVSETPKTDKSNRVILLDDTTAALIDGLEKNSTYIFPNTKGSFITPSQPIRQLHRVVDDTDLKYVSSHGFRHTHCNMLFSAGVSIPEVQDRLGHEDVKTTLDVYNHVYQEDKTAALKRFIDFMK